MGKIERMMAEFWTEKRPEPLNLSDTEIVDFVQEYVEKIDYKCVSPEYVGGFTVYVYDQKTTRPLFRDAVCMAAARWKEANS